MTCIVATSPSFSKSPELRQELLQRFPNARLNDDGIRLSGKALWDFCKDADGVVIGLEPVDQAFLDACSSLKIVAKYGVGLDNVDIPACEAAGVAIGWSGGVNRRSVSELTLAFMLGMIRNVIPSGIKLRNGIWNKAGGRQLSGCTVGLIGLGYVGLDVARVLQPFGCRILGNDILDKSAEAAELGIELVDKDIIWRDCDIVSLHTPLTDETHHMVNADVLATMRTDAFLVNTARGKIVDQDALKIALKQQKIAGAALDVYVEEPPTDTEFLNLPNLFSTPHIGGSAQEAVLAMGQNAIRHLDAFFTAEAAR